jgi:hypothetical protein
MIQCLESVRAPAWVTVERETARDGRAIILGYAVYVAATLIIVVKAGVSLLHERRHLLLGEVEKATAQFRMIARVAC